MNKQLKAEPINIELQTTSEDQRPIYIAGNFNNWQAADPKYQLLEVGKGQYRFTFPNRHSISFPLEYKYLRGNWDGEELNEFGQKRNNRIIREYSALIKDQVNYWRYQGQAFKDQFLPQIKVISEAFEIPQLIKTRRIAALLPHDYDQSDKHYPVLYLQDGQNLFDDYAPFGNWAVDKKLAVLAEQGIGDVIIVAIDHAAEERIAEFTPTSKTQLGLGEGKKYVRFLAETLKPYVDQHFRTLPQREFTGIGGSSMGGLISIYAGITRPDEYGKLMIFSPSLWVDPNIHFHAINFSRPYNMDIYLYAGGRESTNMIPNIRRFQKALSQKGINQNAFRFKLSLDPHGEHNEARWGQEFPKAAKWLFYDTQNKLP